MTTPPPPGSDALREREQHIEVLRELAEDYRFVQQDYVDALNAAIAALASSPAPVGGAWQPIETAPKDGTFVLLTDADCDPCHLIGQWEGGLWWGQRTKSGKAILWTVATHWMPLPTPPQRPEGESA